MKAEPSSLFRLTLIVIAIVLGISGCKAPTPTSPLNPPSWIIGTWSDDLDIVTWTFTGENAIWSTSTTTINFKEADGGETTISDLSTDTSYTIQVSEQGVTQSYVFEKVDSTTITWATLRMQLHKVVPVAVVTGVSVLPVSATVLNGQSLQLTATIAPSNATDQRVVWSTSNDTVAVVGASGLVVAFSVGDAVIMVTTNDGGKTATCAIKVVDTPTPPVSPSPSNGSTTNEATPLLDWEDSFGATNYYLQVNTDPSFTGAMVFESSSLTTSEYQLSAALSNYTTYYWRVRVSAGGLWSLWSSTWSFTVQVVPPSSPSPANGSALPDDTPLLNWEDMSGATGYHVQVNTDSSFTGTMVFESSSLTTSEHQLSAALSSSTTYYWRVRVSAGGLWSLWSSTWSFLILAALPTSPIKIVASDAHANDSFGQSVAISGDYAIVGSGFEDAAASDAGAAYIYSRTVNNTWNAETKLTAPDAQAGDLFGISVGISGDYAIVGALSEDAGGSDAGAAYVFHRTSANSWDAGTKLLAGDAQANDMFGCTVAISGDYALVGAAWEDAGGDRAGAAYLYHRTGVNTWDAGTKIVAPDAEGNDMFGYFAAINGDYALVGAMWEGAGGGKMGAAYVYCRTGVNTWDAGTKLVAADAYPDAFFGISVAICGDYIVVGAPMQYSGGIRCGAAYIYHRVGTNSWDDGTKIIAPDAQYNDAFGESVAIDGDYIIVGADCECAGGDGAGAAYLYHRTGTNIWDSGTKILASDATATAQFGIASAISGHYAIIGARYDSAAGSAAGAAYVQLIPY